jgi:hypothetical protein
MITNQEKHVEALRKDPIDSGGRLGGNSALLFNLFSPHIKKHFGSKA